MLLKASGWTPHDVERNRGFDSLALVAAQQRMGAMHAAATSASFPPNTSSQARLEID
jgi:hypothetical protein